MKKLMFALIAGVAVSAAQAVDVFEDGEGFENSPLGAFSVSTTDEQSYNSKFVFDANGSAENGSTVTNGTPYGGTRSLYFREHSNTKFLNLMTDGGTLYRSILERDGDNVLGVATNLTKSFYIDTLVQFTVCDQPPPIDENAKLAIWLEADETVEPATTNLMVQAKLWEVYADGGNAGFDSLGTTNLVLSGTGTYEPGTWYRLTVEAVPNMFSSGKYAAGFKIKIDGSEVHAVSGGSFVLASEQSATLAELLGLHADSAQVAAMTSGSVFASIQGTTSETTPTLQAVGFSGTGLVDDILFTSYDPDNMPVDALDFTITLASGVTAVSYSISGSTPVTIGATTTLAQLPLNTVVTLSGLTGSGVDGWDYQVANITESSNCSVDGNEVTLDVVDDASVTVGLVAKTVETAADVTAAMNALELNNAIKGYVGTDPEKYDALITWASDHNYDVARVNAYPYTTTRLAAGLPIETLVNVTFDANVANDALTPMTVTVDAESGSKVVTPNYPQRKITAAVDAGYGLTVSGLAFAEGKKLQTDAESGDWDVSYATVDATALTETAVRFETSVSAPAQGASASIATMNAAPTTYDFTVAFEGNGVSSVKYTIGLAETTSETNFTVAVESGASVTFALASDYTQPLFFSLADAGATTNYAPTLTFTSAANTSLEYGAISMASASGSAAEDAATNAVAEVVVKIADVDAATANAIAAKVKATAADAGTSVSVGEVSSWVASKVTTAAQCTALAAAPAAAVEASVKLDTTTIFEEEPKAEVSKVEESSTAGAYDLTFTISDSKDNTAAPANTDAVKEYVGSLVKMTSDLSNWNTGALTPTVGVTIDGTTLKATVTPPSNTPTAFMKIGK